MSTGKDSTDDPQQRVTPHEPSKSRASRAPRHPLTPDESGKSLSGGQHQRTVRERPRSVEPIDPHEAPQTPSRSLHTSKKALAGNKQRAAGKADDVSATDDIPPDELTRPNPHFTP